MSDSKNDVKIDVTANDIWYGRRFSRTECPVAIAATRALQRRVRVSMDAISLVGQSVQQRLPDVASDFIMDLDCGRLVRPISFPLTIPKEWR